MRGVARFALRALALGLFGAALLGAPGLAAQDDDLDIPVMIQTVPELPGAVFELDGKAFRADEHGLALITVSRRDTYRLEAPAGGDLDDGESAEFARWSDDSFSPSRSVAVDSFTYLEAGFDVLRPLEASFVGHDGTTLGDVRSFTLVDDLGVERTYAVGEPIAIRVSRATVGTKGGLRSEPVFYELGEVSLEEGTIAPPPGRVLQAPDGPRWNIELGFHDVRIVSTDALLGGPAGETVNLQYPDGRRVDVTLDARGQATLESLPSGNYVARVSGGLLAVEERFSLPGPGRVDADVVTLADALIAIVALSLVGTAVVLTARGRVARRSPPALAVSAAVSQESLTVAHPSPEGVARGGHLSIFGLSRKKTAVARAPSAARPEPEAQPIEPETADALTAKLQALAEEIDSAAGELARVRTEKASMEAEMRAASQRLQEEVRAHEARAAELAAELDGVRRESEGLRARLEALEGDGRRAREKARVEIAALAAERDDLAGGLATSLRELEALRGELEQARGRLAAAGEVRTQRDRLEATLADVSADRDRLRAEVAQAVSERDTAYAERDASRADLAAAVAEADRASAEREVLVRELDAARAGVAEARAQSSAWREERAALNDKLKNALAQLVATEEIRAERDRAQAANDTLKREREALSHKLKQALAQLVPAEEVRAERDRLRSERDGLRVERDRLRSERDELRSRPAGADPAARDPLREALGRLVTAENIRTQREDLHAELDGLRRQNEILRARVRELEGAAPGRDDRVEVEVARPAGARPPAPVLRLDPDEAQDDEAHQQEPWWRAFIQQADRY